MRAPTAKHQMVNPAPLRYVKGLFLWGELFCPPFTA